MRIPLSISTSRRYIWRMTTNSLLSSSGDVRKKSGVTKNKRQVTINDFFSSSTAKKSKIVVVQDVKEETSLEENFNKKISVEKEPKENAVLSEIKQNFSKALDDKTRVLLDLELRTLEDSWFNKVKDELTKPYFTSLKEFVTKEKSNATVFPPSNDIYSWSQLTPFDKVKVVIIGQDPYHNYKQAHGLAFSVMSPTPAPPSLKNIYKELQTNNYSDFKIDNTKGDLTCWASQGVLLLNTSLTVRAHNANSHAKHGWEQFTSRIVELLIQDRETTGKGIVFLLWGNNAIKLVEKLLTKVSQEKGKQWKDFNNLLVLKSVHPSPLSASRGFFGNNHFKQINDWLYNDQHESMIDWSIVPGFTLEEVKKANESIVSPN